MVEPAAAATAGPAGTAPAPSVPDRRVRTESGRCVTTGGRIGARIARVQKPSRR